MMTPLPLLSRKCDNSLILCSFTPTVFYIQNLLDLFCKQHFKHRLVGNILPVCQQPDGFNKRLRQPNRDGFI